MFRQKEKQCHIRLLDFKVTNEGGFNDILAAYDLQCIARWFKIH